MGFGFWGQSSRPAYTAAGSFCLWLAKTRGVKALADLYGSAGDFEGTYGESLSALEGEWLTFLRTLLQLRADPLDAEAVGQGRIDLHRLARDPRLLLRRHMVQRPHVVEAIGELHQEHPDVLAHRQEHLAKALGLLLLAREIGR